MSYATLSNLLAYAPHIPTPDAASPEEAHLLRVIAKAEEQLDTVLTYSGPRDETVYRRVKPMHLATWDRECLRTATCAQAEYRLRMGEEHFNSGQHTEVTGPEFATKGRLPLISPVALDELRKSDALYRTTGVAYSGRKVPDDLYWEDL